MRCHRPAGMTGWRGVRGKLDRHFLVSLEQTHAALGIRRVNHCELASGAGATIGAGTLSPASPMRAAQSLSVAAEGQRLAAADDRRSSDEAPPRQRGATGRWAKERGRIDGIFQKRCSEIGTCTRNSIAVSVP